MRFAVFTKNCQWWLSFTSFKMNSLGCIYIGVTIDWDIKYHLLFSVPLCNYMLLELIDFQCARLLFKLLFMEQILMTKLVI